MRKAMRDEVGDTALRLFLDRGFDETTVEQICATAGVSRSSFFRYFPTKEDVVLEDVAAYGERILEALVLRPDDEAPWEALRKALESQVLRLDADKDRFLRLWRLVNQTASVRARQYERSRAWRELLVPEIARRLGLPDAGAADPGPAALVGSAIICLEAATEAWTHAGGTVPMPVLLGQAMGTVNRSSGKADDPDQD